ncbi:hypothetical protein JSE7799_01632 [Jannaschia seosinensis]|uniref:Uncharacterized protein n=1 Tax=Jannaschia seosinensis TaxID=313367 RepID=A0A0M7BAF3_9RHOB|nr:hypothetical protein JSE7799_01632 [Jannaschia seosinensis]
MTDFFLLAVAAMAVLVLVRLLTRGWPEIEDEEEAREEV